MNAYLKAIFGSVTAGLGALQVALLDGHVTASEWAYVASVTVYAAAIIWGVPNLIAPDGTRVGVAEPPPAD